MGRGEPHFFTFYLALRPYPQENAGDGATTEPWAEATATPSRKGKVNKGKVGKSATKVKETLGEVVRNPLSAVEGGNY